jgi:hypothetical protein
VFLPVNKYFKIKYVTGLFMTLFPSLDQSYYTENDTSFLQYMDDIYSKNITINQSFWSEADIDSRFKVGDQTLWNDIYGNLPAFRRKQFNFNRIRRVVNMITGYQRQHRKSIIVDSRENGAEQTAKQFTKCLFYSNQTNQVLQTVSQAFEGAVTTGMNLLGVWMDYRSDPINGEIKVDNLAYNSYLIDPFFKKQDLSDCNNLWTRKYISREQAKGLFPGREQEIDGLQGYANRDGKFQFMPEAYNYAQSDLLTYDEVWYLSTRKQKLLVDTQSGETIEWRGNDSDLQEFLSIYRNVVTIDNDIQTVNLGLVLQGRVMYNGTNPLGTDRYPFVPVWCYYEPQIPYFPWRIQGVVRGLRDSQYLYNRRKVIELDILESQINSGYIYKENALVNPKDVFLEGQGRGLALKSSADPARDVQKIQPPQIPPSMIELSQLLGKEIQEISGVSDELLGMADDDKAGVLSMLRQGANLTTLQGLFDNLDFSLKLLGQLQIDLIQNNWTPGKIERIVKEQPTPEFYTRAFGKYDAVVEEGLNTTTQKQMEFRQLLELRELGIPVPTEHLIKTSTLSNKDELIQSMAAQEQQQSQIQMAEKEAQISLVEARVDDLKGRSMANQGLFLERASRIEENSALATERRAEAQADRDKGTLDRIKAIKELEGMDLEQITKMLSLLQGLQQKTSEDQKETEIKEKITET